ncbi:putative kinesin [Trypanosoma grayi]|uniref:putative kinesin n=1 Tax=Trypanosoma grayi TaxID=71804 RepID=UPI0004F46EFD|nr:putative kinesin [Trypanosoma grayi]KEG14179.1 putative kinesin [Trypanosoma grayi]
MSSSSFSHIPLDLPQITAASSAAAPSSCRGEKCGLPSVRGRIRTERTPRAAHGSQDFVHVAVRLKPPPQNNESNDLIQFSIAPGTLASPRTGRRRESSLQNSTARTVKNVDEETNSNSATRLDDQCAAPNSSCPMHSSTAAIGLPLNRNGMQRTPRSPRVGSAGASGNNGGKILTVTSPTADGAKEMQRVYEFGDIISPSVTDAQICDSIVPCITEQLLAGFNACVLCYGQTGSGKTHTINTLIPAFVSTLFENLDAGNDIVEVSYIQIHNNNAYNLLGGGRSEHGVLLQKPKSAYVREPRYLVRGAEDMKAKIAEAQRKRFVGSHALNARSSRSHVLLSLHVTKLAGGIPVQTSRLTLGDLAGSERVKKTGVAGDELEEAIAINKSLSVLHAVIKATAEDANVLPVRESVLTLYLASSLAGCYLLLIATVSLEKKNYAETKSSLDFAATAKKCIVRKAKGQPRDLFMSGACSFEEVYSHLTREIEILRDRVCTLQEEVNIEKQRSVLVQREENCGTGNANHVKIGASPDDAVSLTCAPPDNSSEKSRLRDHVRALERQCGLFQEILRERERELSSLQSRGDLAPEVREELEQLAREREEAQRALEEAAPQLGTSELLRTVTDTFFSMQEQFDGMCQQRQIMAKTMEVMRGEQQRITLELLEARRQLVQSEKSCEEMRCKTDEVTIESRELRNRLEELNLRLLREYAERAIREETVAWFKASSERDEEYEQLRSAFEEQRNLFDVLQCRLTSTEQELDRSNKQHGTLLEEMRKKDEAFRTIWLLLTPQQKARLMSIGYSNDDASGSGNASLHQGHENVQLRSQVRTLKRQLDEELLRIKERDYRLEDLENENRLLNERLQNREDEYNSLVSLDQDYRDEREKMEQQIAHLYTYIEEHNAKQHIFERQLREAQTEWEKMDEKHRSAQREVVDLTAKLEKAMGEIRTQEANRDKFKDRLHEVQERDAVLVGLHRQLAAKQRTADETSRRLGLSERRRQHIASEATIYNRHSDLVKLKVMHRNPELLRKVALQRIDLAQFVRGTSLHHLTQYNRTQRLRHEGSSPPRLYAGSSISHETARPRLDSNGSSSQHRNGCRRRQLLSPRNTRGVAARSALLRANSAMAEAPNQIIDKTRRRNS